MVPKVVGSNPTGHPDIAAVSFLAVGGILLYYMNQCDIQLKERLDDLAGRYNVPEFAASDPVGFPRSFSAQEDIEISALLTSAIAWGRRPMILRNVERMHALLDHQPAHFVMTGDIESIPDDNIHRTFFGRHLRYFLRGLRLLYGRYGTLENFAVSTGAKDSGAPAWIIADALGKLLAEANAGCPLDGPNRCLPADMRTTALKRFNMALRWLVRDDGIVDIGCWSALRPSQLYIPLDVHSASTARSLGLLKRRSNDRRAVEELTGRLREFRPEDPTVYDFALFGAGISGEIPRG